MTTYLRTVTDVINHVRHRSEGLPLPDAAVLRRAADSLARIATHMPEWAAEEAMDRDDAIRQAITICLVHMGSNPPTACCALLAVVRDLQRWREAA